MTHHHHDPGQAHPIAHIAPSLLRMSALERLAVAVSAAIVLWAAVWWALSQT
jgi:hypothetical protein